MGRRIPARQKWYLSILIAFIFIVCPETSFGQGTSTNAEHGGRVRGQLSDPAGLAVTNVPVTIRKRSVWRGKDGRNCRRWNFRVSRSSRWRLFAHG